MCVAIEALTHMLKLTLCFDSVLKRMHYLHYLCRGVKTHPSVCAEAIDGEILS